MRDEAAVAVKLEVRDGKGFGTTGPIYFGVLATPHGKE